MTQPTVVLGAGYAGVMAANRLAGRGEPVVLVSMRPDFTERIRLHRLAAGLRSSVRIPLTDLVSPKVRLVIDRAARIDADRRAVHLDSGASLDYETLVYAVGSGAGGSPRTHRIAEEAGALTLRAELRARPADPVVIAGSGLTGIELAAALAASGREVSVVTASTMTERATARAHLARLRRLGVAVRTNTRVDPAALDGGIAVDTTGFSVPALAVESGLPTTPDGRLIVDATLRAAGVAGIVGAGDAVFVDDPAHAHLRASCAAAMPMGAHAADVVRAIREGAAPSPFSFGYLLQCVDLGGAVGRVQFIRADDGEGAFALTGRFGGLAKETICRYTVSALRAEGRRAGSFRWRSGPVSAVVAR